MPAHRTDHELRYRYQQAAIVGAALRGELGIERQLLAMSARYHELRAAGRLDEAKALKEQAIAIHAAAQAAEQETQITAMLDEILRIVTVEIELATAAAARSTWLRRRNAVIRARNHFAAGVRLLATPAGYTAPSASHPGAVYHLSRVGSTWRCTCESHSFCWHQALAAAYEATLDRPAQSIRRAA